MRSIITIPSDGSDRDRVVVPTFWIACLIATVLVPATSLAQDSELPEDPSTFTISGRVDLPDDFPLSMVAVIALDTGLYDITDSDGWFSIGPYPQGEYRLLLWREDLVETEVSGVIDSRDVDLVIPMEAAGIVEGIVTLEDPRDYLAGTIVSASGTTWVETDDQGYYRLDLERAVEVQLSYRRDGYREQSLDLEVRGITEVDVALSASGEYTLTGVIATDGTVLAGARVQLEGSRLSSALEITSDDLGEYLFEHLSPGTYRLTASARGMRSLSVEPLLVFDDVVLRLNLIESPDYDGPACSMGDSRGQVPLVSLAWLALVAIWLTVRRRERYIGRLMVVD